MPPEMLAILLRAFFGRILCPPFAIDLIFARERSLGIVPPNHLRYRSAFLGRLGFQIALARDLFRLPPRKAPREDLCPCRIRPRVSAYRCLASCGAGYGSQLDSSSSSLDPSSGSATPLICPARRRSPTCGGSALAPTTTSCRSSCTGLT